jgi:hypothetical protein
MWRSVRDADEQATGTQNKLCCRLTNQVVLRPFIINTAAGRRVLSI